MTINQNSKKYDLEERTYIFATNVRRFLKKLLKTYSNIEDSKQLIRASGSVAATELMKIFGAILSKSQ